jgi:hypothetical protein
MTNITPVPFAPTSSSSSTSKTARPKVGAKVKRFLDALLRSLAAPAF